MLYVVYSKFSGTHGDEEGYTCLEDDDYREASFVDEDEEIVEEMQNKNSRCDQMTYKVLDIFLYKEDDLGLAEIIEEFDADVYIMAYCYSQRTIHSNDPLDKALKMARINLNCLEEDED